MIIAAVIIIRPMKKSKCLSLIRASLVGQSVKNLPAVQETWILIPWSGRSPEEGNGTPLQHSCPENPTDRGAWWAVVHGVPKSRAQLSD